jgi:chromosome segregation ATPase
MDERKNRQMVFDIVNKLKSDRDRIRTLEKTVEELREINADLAGEVSRLEKEVTRYKCVIETIESRINKRRADIQEMSKRLYQVMHTAKASLKFCEDMGKCIDTEEHYADTVY